MTTFRVQLRLHSGTTLVWVVPDQRAIQDLDSKNKELRICCVNCLTMKAVSLSRPN